jgi:membrane associated rhomboid family serine protease
VPLSDRDYMSSSPPPRRGLRKPRNYRWLNLDPIWVIILINFIVYIATIINGDVIHNLGLVPAALGTRPWTILTAMFVHASFWHIFGNMITLYFFGTFLSKLVGNGKFLLVYFGGGILGNALYILLNTSSGIPVIGASGAVYALAGALVVMMPKLRVFLYFVVPLPLWVVVLVFFVFWSFIPGVAWQAHLGGLVAGLIAGYFFRRRGGYYYVR